MVFRASRRALSRCGWVGIVARKRVDGERATQTRDGEHGKTMVPLSGSSKNDAQLLYQNITQSVLRKTREAGDDASRSYFGSLYSDGVTPNILLKYRLK